MTRDDKVEKGLLDGATEARMASRSHWWLVVRSGNCQLEELLTLERDGQEGSVLPVFSFEEEAEMFCWLDELGDGWEVRQSSPGELTSLLYGLCAGVKNVLLDPLPRKVAGGSTLGLVSVDRKEFVDRLLGGERTLSRWVTLHWAPGTRVGLDEGN